MKLDLRRAQRLDCTNFTSDANVFKLRTSYKLNVVNFFEYFFCVRFCFLFFSLGFVVSRTRRFNSYYLTETIFTTFEVYTETV